MSAHPAPAPSTFWGADGRGVAPDAAGAGRGLQNMRTRARRIGASLSLESDEKGSRLELRMPGDDAYSVTPLPGVDGAARPAGDAAAARAA